MSADAAPAPANMTLDELREALAPRVAANAAFDGWGAEAVAAAAAELDVPADRALLALPGGPVGMIDAWFASIDAAMATAVPAPATLRIRDRIAALVMARIEAAAPAREALRRALSILALPQNAGTGLRLGWRAADAMWRQAGDTATDLNHYTKRATLGAIYAATLLAFLDDESEDLADTRAFLDRRIGDLMRFETLKARLRPDPDRRFSVTRFLGRLRYPAT